MPETPVANNITISGIENEYETLTLDYDFYDVNGDSENGSKFIWQVSEDGENWTDIPNETEKTYTIPNKYIGNYIRGLVKPIADAEPAIGTYTASEKIGPILISPDYVNFKYTDLLLEHTKTSLAIGEASQINVSGTSDRGGIYDITGHPKLSYASSDEIVATVSDTGVITANKEGVTIITATLKNDDGDIAQGKLAVAVYNGTINYQSFEAMKFDETVDTHVAATQKVVNTGDYALKLSKFPSGSSSSYAKSGRWDIYRKNSYVANMVLQAWFYDSGEENNSEDCVYFQSYDRDKTGTVIPVTGRYNIGYTSKTSKQYYSIESVAKYRSSDKTGTLYVGAGDVNSALDGTNSFAKMERTRGWHQVTLVSVGKYEDRFTDKGTVNIYLDGELIFTENYVHPIMHVVAGLSLYSIPSASYYDDFTLFQYISKKPVSVIHNGYGTVTVNGEAVNNGEEIEIDAANGINIIAEPQDGYQAHITINDVSYDGNNIILNDITEALDIKVKFVIETSLSEIIISDYNTAVETAGKTVNITVPVTIAEENTTYKAVLAVYGENNNY